ncbi:uncharacterized protein SPAPADRAFT_153731 [Spathaspora passalidarum NRRL Y-27907]|uniref:Karyogamy protein n=1 Tax=Spathaspora passalidarum (strain NRRL Y-27907 / 11-Y1) TaxID=619300 RepID=G3ANX5_SPAPN|nr:uncharacterized protein SPAPADRAFT_153731 [Spathaspora passalidarum NRRL Y-27907]EGW32600.1 hypothetical protein SPAPADRAFT_153731 [Spathaspora passalidarum NRRL Y-27907]
MSNRHSLYGSPYKFRESAYRQSLRPDVTALSEVLSTAPNFSFFDELINIPQPGSKLLKHDIFRSGKLLQDIQSYLLDLIKILKFVSEVSNEHIHANVLDWYLEGKEALFDIVRTIDSIESILNQLILVFESDEDEHIPSELVTSFDNANDVLLEVKKYMILVKRSLDIAINYQEINQGIIKALITEIEDCIKSIFKLRELKIASPKRVLPKFNLNDITRKMKINDFTATAGGVSMKTIRLPTFNDTDEKLYCEYLEIESKINPLKISLNIVPIKIDEFNNMCSSAYKHEREEILAGYESMCEKWQYLHREMALLKHDTIDVKWNEIFKYLIEEIADQCDFMIEEIPTSTCSSLSSSPSTASSSTSSLITDEIAIAYKQCANSITMITKAFNEQIIHDEALAEQFNNKLLPKWKQVCDLIQDSKSSRHRSLPVFKPSVAAGLKSFQTGSRHSYDGAKLNSWLGGIDIGLDVENTAVPLSVEKPDRIKSFNNSEVNGKNLEYKLKNVFEETETSVPEFNYTNFFNQILSSTAKFESKIPKIAPNYHRLGFPIIKKKINPNCKIPEINFTHPVFNSPERNKEAYDFESPTRARPVSAISSLPTGTKFSLNQDKPDLAFEKYTSPKRPVSMISERQLMHSRVSDFLKRKS